MEQIVYIDLYVMINFSMDLLCLMITASLLHRRVNRLRAVAAAILGGFWAAVSLLCAWGGALSLILDVAVAVLLCAVAFFSHGNRFLQLMRCALVFFLTSMLVGGVMTGLYSLLNRLELPFEALGGDGLSVWTFALLSAVAGIATLRGGSFLGLSHRTRQVTVNATLFGKEVTLCAMVDSGNLLRDPVSGKRVIVAEVKRLAEVLPVTLAQACRSGRPSLWLSDYENARLVHPVPMQTASGKALLLGLVPERLTLTVGKETYAADYLIAPTSLGDSARGFDAMIAPD